MSKKRKEIKTSCKMYTPNQIVDIIEALPDYSWSNLAADMSVMIAQVYNLRKGEAPKCMYILATFVLDKYCDDNNINIENLVGYNTELKKLKAKYGIK